VTKPGSLHCALAWPLDPLKRALHSGNGVSSLRRIEMTGRVTFAPSPRPGSRLWCQIRHHQDKSRANERCRLALVMAAIRKFQTGYSVGCAALRVPTAQK